MIFLGKIMNISNDITKWLIAPTVTAILMWGSWISVQSFNSKQNETITTNYIVEIQKQQDYIRNQLEEIKIKNFNDYKELTTKIDKNQENNYKILMDIQKQIRR